VISGEYFFSLSLSLSLCFSDSKREEKVDEEHERISGQIGYLSAAGTSLFFASPFAIAPIIIDAIKRTNSSNTRWLLQDISSRDAESIRSQRRLSERKNGSFARVRRVRCNCTVPPVVQIRTIIFGLMAVFPVLYPDIRRCARTLHN